MISKIVSGPYSVFAMPMPKTYRKYMILKIVCGQYSVFAMQMSKTQWKFIIFKIVRWQYNVFCNVNIQNIMETTDFRNCACTVQRFCNANFKNTIKTSRILQISSKAHPTGPECLMQTAYRQEQKIAKCASQNKKHGREARFDSGEYAFGSTKTDAGRYVACFCLYCDFSKSIKIRYDVPSKWIIKSQQNATWFKLGPKSPQLCTSKTLLKPF